MAISKFDELLRILKQSIEYAKAFSNLLSQEKEALTNANYELLTNLVSKKQDLIDLLTIQKQELTEFFQTHSVPLDFQSLKSSLIFHKIENQEEILKCWSDLKNTLLKNQASNKTNETILIELTKRNKIKQSILQNILSSENTLYTKSGINKTQSHNDWVEQV